MNSTKVHKKYISDLIANDENVEFVAYTKSVGKLAGVIPDDTFTDDMKDYVTKEDFDIPHSKLFEYGVITGSQDSKYVLEYLLRCDLKEEEDYEIREIESNNRNHSKRKLYYLTSDAFSICLQSSRNCKVYKKWFSHLQKSYVFYERYQNELKAARALREKDSAIYNLNKKLDDMERKFCTKVDEATSQLTLTTDRLAEATDKLTEVRVELTETRAELAVTNERYMDTAEKLEAATEVTARLEEKVVESQEKIDALHDNITAVQDHLGMAIEDRVPKPVQDFWVIKLNHVDPKVHDYALRYGKPDHYYEAMKKIRVDYPRAKALFAIKSHPNPLNLIDRFVEKMGKNICVDKKYRLCSPMNIPHRDFLWSILCTNSEKYTINGKLVCPPKMKIVYYKK